MNDDDDLVYKIICVEVGSGWRFPPFPERAAINSLLPLHLHLIEILCCEAQMLQIYVQ